MTVKKYIGYLILLVSFNASAEGFHYCSGKITRLVTRATTAGTQVAIEGMTGWARVDFNGEERADMQARQMSMLLAAYMADKSVTLEFLDDSLSCTDNHDGMSIRYVLLK